MTEIPISPEIWKLAEAILTEKQKAVLELREKRGYSWNQLAITFNCTRANVREHHRAATRNMLNAIEAAGGDIDYALVIALGQEGIEPEQIIASSTIEVKVSRDWSNFDQPRPTSEETPEEKTEYDFLWKGSA